MNSLHRSTRPGKISRELEVWYGAYLLTRMVMVYCFIWLSQQEEAPWKPSHAVNQPLAKIRANEYTMAQ